MFTVCQEERRSIFGESPPFCTGTKRSWPRIDAVARVERIQEAMPASTWRRLGGAIDTVLVWISDIGNRAMVVGIGGVEENVQE
jgi:hypothetical protein